MARVMRSIGRLLVVIYAIIIVFEAVALFAFIDISLELMNEPCSNKSRHGANLTHEPQFPIKCSSSFLRKQSDPYHRYPHFELVYRHDGLDSAHDMLVVGRLLTSNSSKPNGSNYDAGYEHENDIKEDERNVRGGDLLMRSSFQIDAYNVLKHRMANYFCNLYLCAQHTKSGPVLNDVTSSKENIDIHENAKGEYDKGSNEKDHEDKQNYSGEFKEKLNLTSKGHGPSPFLFTNSTNYERLAVVVNDSHSVLYRLNEENEASTKKTYRSDTNKEKDKNTDLSNVHFTFIMRDTTLNILCKKMNTFDEHKADAKSQSLALNSVKYAVRSKDEKNDILTFSTSKTNNIGPTTEKTIEFSPKDNSGRTTDFTTDKNNVIKENVRSITGKAEMKKNVGFTEVKNVEDKFMRFPTIAEENIKETRVRSTTEKNVETFGDIMDKNDPLDKVHESNRSSNTRKDKVDHEEKASKRIHRNEAGRDMDTKNSWSWLWSVLGAIFTGSDGQDRGDVTESIFGAMESILSGNDSVLRDWRRDSNDDYDDDDDQEDGRIPYNQDECDAEEFFYSKLAIYLHVFGMVSSFFCTHSVYRTMVKGQTHPAYLSIATLAASVFGFFSIVIWSMATYKETDRNWVFWPYIGCYFYLFPNLLLLLNIEPNMKNFINNMKQKTCDILTAAISILLYTFYCQINPRDNSNGESGAWQNIEEGSPNDERPALPSGTSSGSPSNDDNGGDSHDNGTKQSPKSSSSSPRGAVGGTKKGDVSSSDSNENARRKPPMKETTPLLQAKKATPTTNTTPTTPLLVKLAKNTPLPEVTADEPTRLSNGVAGGGPYTAFGGRQEPDFINETMSLLHSALATPPDAPINGLKNDTADEATPLMNGIDQDLDGTVTNGTQDTSINVDSVD